MARPQKPKIVHRIDSPAQASRAPQSMSAAVEEFVIAKYGREHYEELKAHAAELDAKQSAVEDQHYLKRFPGDLQRARRLGRALKAIRLEFDKVHFKDWPTLVEAVSDAYARPVAPTMSLPTKAPELWSKRDKDAKENPTAFVRRVYRQWIGYGLTRPLLRELDEDLYHAMSVWEHRHPEDAVTELPTLAQVIDAKIARLSDEFSRDELRKLGLTIQNRMRRSKN